MLNTGSVLDTCMREAGPGMGHEHGPRGTPRTSAIHGSILMRSGTPNWRHDDSFATKPPPTRGSLDASSAPNGFVRAGRREAGRRTSTATYYHETASDDR